MKVIFPVRACAGSPSDGHPVSYSKTINLSDITFGDPTVTPQPKGVKDTVFVIRDTALALYSAPAGPPTNQAALDDLALQLATDFYNFRSIQFSKVYNGVIPIPPNALIDLMEFGYDATEQATRIASQPWGGEATEQQHQDGAISACHDFDRTPGIHIDIPGGTTNQSMQGVLSLEDGRLVMTYDSTMSVPCGCSSTPPCGQLCTTLTGCGDLSGVNVTVKTQNIVSIAVTAGGTGYTSPPTVTLSTTNGNGGAATAVLTGGVVTSINVNNGGAYVGAVTATLSGGGGTGATAGTVTLSSDVTVGSCSIVGQVVTVTRTSAGNAYTSMPTATTSGGGGGSGATFILTMQAQAGTVVAGGTGYVVGNLLTVAGGTSTVATALQVSAVGGGGVITAVTIFTAGAYTALPTNPVSVTGGAGVGATFNLTWNLTAIAIASGGSGYTANPTVVFSGGSPVAPAAATATFAYKCCVGVPTSGKYKVSTDACTPASTIVTVTCPSTANVTIAAAGTVSFQVILCGSCGTTVAGSGPGAASWTLTGMGCTRTSGLGALCRPSFSISRMGTYTLTGPTGTCYQSTTTTLAINQCSGLLSYSQSPAPSTYTATYTATGCAGLPLQNASLTLAGGGYSQTQVTNSSGVAVFSSVPADCDMTITGTYSRFVTVGPTAVHSACSNWSGGIIFTTPIAGYVCSPCVAYPLPVTMFVTDPKGTATVRYGAFLAGNFWQGCHTIAGATVGCLDAGGACARTGVAPFPTIFYAGQAAVQYTFGGAGATIGGPAGCSLNNGWPSCQDQNAGGSVVPMNGCCNTTFSPPGDVIGLQSAAACGVAGPYPCTSPLPGGNGASNSIHWVSGPPSIPPFTMTVVTGAGENGPATGTVVISE